MRVFLTFATACAVLGSSTFAFAYCRTTTCAQQNPPPECVPGQVVRACQMTGIPLFWGKPCVSFSVQKDGSHTVPEPGSTKPVITAKELESIVRTSFDNWQSADCAAGKPNIAVKTYAQVECAEARYNKSGPNQNVWMFRDDEWPHQGDGDRTIALTLVSFSPKTGEIYDVDVELNSYMRNFDLETGGMGDDLQSVVQHESGHFLGLAHSDISTATMWSNYNGSVDMRTLEQDDWDGICAAYPPTNPPDTTCTANPRLADPRHGFSTQCAQTNEGCSIGYARSPVTRSGLELLAAAFGWAWLRTRRRRSLDGSARPHRT